ncbi:MAG: OmpA family protein [Planctomycetota bacterium]
MDDPEWRATHETAALTELVRAEEIARLSPHDEIRQPRIATFESDSDLIDEASREYIDALADSLRPRSGQVLSLEGHATDAGPRFGFDDARLAFARARAVSDYLVREHGFDEGRIRPKAWLSEVATDRTTRGVDARLIVPAAGGR